MAKADLPTVFVSHDATGDGPLALALIDLIEIGVGAKHPQVFCTSQKGQGVTVGEKFNEDIRQQLIKAKVVLALISENFWGSPFCIGEIGAVWYEKKKIFVPVLVPPLGYDGLRGVVGQTEALKLDRDEDLDRLWDELTKALQIAPRVAAPKWTRKKEEFLKALPALLKRCPPRAPVSRAELAKVKNQVAEYKAAYETAEQENEKLQAQNADLAKLKDKAKVATVLRKHTTAIEQFQSLTEAARKVLVPLPYVVQQALYFRSRGEPYNPKDDEDWDLVNTADQEGFMNNPGDDPPTVRSENRKVAAAMEAVDALEEWLDKEQPEAFFDWYDAEYNGQEPKIQFVPFWERHLTGKYAAV